MLKFIKNLIKNSSNIEQTYSDCDRALDRLQALNENPQKFSSDQKDEINELANSAIASATRLLEFGKPRSSWEGLCREMHQYLAKFYLELDEREKFDRHCQELKSYGEVGRTDAEDLIEKSQEKLNSG